MEKEFWLQPASTKIGAGQRLIKEITGSSTFCVLPWIHVATRPNGDMRLCCTSNASGADVGDYEIGLVKKLNGKPANFSKETIEESFNNSYMKNVRKLFLENRIPESCTKCFEEEANGIVSKRLWEAYEWNNNKLDFKKLIDETVDGTVPNKIKYFDLRLGHTCNLKCVMCSPHDSSKWLEDYDYMIENSKSNIVTNQLSWNKENFNNKWHENQLFWEQIYKNIPNITQLYFAGGEPLMIKEHKLLLKEIIRQGVAEKISLRYNSNGLFVNQEMIDLWINFKQVRYAFSIDGLGERNSYIRFPSKWKMVEKSLELLDNTPKNILVSIACVVQALNVKHIVDFAKWKIKKKYKKINNYFIDEYQVGGGIINLHLLYIPTFLNARILCHNDKEHVKEIFAEFKTWLWENYTKDDNFWSINPYGWKRWEGILKFLLEKDDNHLLHPFCDYINNLDNVRGTDFKKTFPELSHIL